MSEVGRIAVVLDRSSVRHGHNGQPLSQYVTASRKRLARYVMISRAGNSTTYKIYPE